MKNYISYNGVSYCIGSRTERFSARVDRYTMEFIRSYRGGSLADKLCNMAADLGMVPDLILKTHSHT